MLTGMERAGSRGVCVLPRIVRNLRFQSFVRFNPGVV